MGCGVIINTQVQRNRKTLDMKAGAGIRHVYPTSAYDTMVNDNCDQRKLHRTRRVCGVVTSVGSIALR